MIDRTISMDKTPSNNEMKQTKPTLAGMARSSLLISVFGGRGENDA
jgi:hypothetical protein